MKDHYETLGVARDASAEEIKAAYRRASSRAHPDREGGSDELQQAVNRAFEILGDPRQRAAYDDYGDESTGLSLARRAQGALQELFSTALDRDYTDFLGSCQQLMMSMRSQVMSDRLDLVAQRGVLAKRSRKVRLKVADGRPDVFAKLVASRLVAIDVKLKALDDQLALHDAVSELLAAYEQDEAASPLRGAVFLGMERWK